MVHVDACCVMQPARRPASERFSCWQVSGQLNAEYYACALTNVYTFGPTFRAENSHTVCAWASDMSCMLLQMQEGTAHMPALYCRRGLPMTCTHGRACTAAAWQSTLSNQPTPQSSQTLTHS